MNQQKSQTYYTRILQKLHLYRRKKRTTLFLTGLFRFWAYEGAFILFLLVLEALFQFPPAVRQALLGVFVLGTLLCLAGTFFAAGRFPWSKSLFSDDRLAGEAGEAFPDIRDQLVDALQIIRNLSQNKENYSPDLAEASLK
ncbi:MAG TPA: hypothetical protein ENH53_03835, partial [Bacteroidetes bacterium]|nr:hypothetical protein [Bacteroidota bacterium]